MPCDENFEGEGSNTKLSPRVDFCFLKGEVVWEKLKGAEGLGRLPKLPNLKFPKLVFFAGGFSTPPVGILRLWEFCS